jgi:hypothetical protein
MGMFCLPQGNKSGDLVECAIGNLQIFMQDWKHDRGVMYCSQEHPNKDLLTAAINYLKEAKETYGKECDENPLINPPRKPDPLVDIDLALEHAKGNTVEDCSMMLNFFAQHPEQTNEFLGRLKCGVQSDLGVTAAIRYTWQSRDQYPNWQKLINAIWNYYKHDREDLLCGLTQFVDK